MERAYRRPITQEELKSKLDLVTLAQKEGDSFDEGIRLALQAILASPNFLFRIETNPRASIAKRPLADRRVPGTVMAMAARMQTSRRCRSTRAVDEYPVSDIELASRLSYFLWASMPDAELMRRRQGRHAAPARRYSRRRYAA